MSHLSRTFAALSRALALTCGCLPYEDPTLCRCRGDCACHGKGGALFMGPEGQDGEPESGPRPVAYPREYATVPAGLILGEGVLRVVHCHLCGGKLRPLSARSVVHEGPGRWRHGTVAGGPDCGRARVPRGGRTLERLLRGSVKEVRSGS